jgi:hypothetical protein
MYLRLSLAEIFLRLMGNCILKGVCGLSVYVIVIMMLGNE